MTADTIPRGPGATMRLVWGALGLFFTAITARVLLADVHSYADIQNDHLLTIGALVGAIVSGVFFGPMLRRCKIVAAIGLALSFLAATVYCLVGSAGRGDDLAYAANAEARKINETRQRYERDRTEAKRRWETAQDAEAEECKSGLGPRCKGRQEITAKARQAFEAADATVRQAQPEARENGKLKRAAELWALVRGGNPADAEKGLALLWPFLPPAICELLSIIFWHQALAHKGPPLQFRFRRRQQLRLPPPSVADAVTVPVTAPSTVVSEPVATPAAFEGGVSSFQETPKPTQAYLKAKKQKPTDLQMVLTALEEAQRPVSNDELASLMRITKGESSKRVRACGDAVVVRRNGRCYAITPNFQMV